MRGLQQVPRAGLPELSVEFLAVHVVSLPVVGRACRGPSPGERSRSELPTRPGGRLDDGCMCEISSPSRTACTANPAGSAATSGSRKPKSSRPCTYVLGTVSTEVPASSPTIVRCRCPATMPRTWRRPSSTSPSDRRLRSASPIASHAGMPVRNGGWCMAINVGCSGDFVKHASQPRELLTLERARILRQRGVKYHQPRRPEIDRVANGLRTGAGQAEMTTQRFAVVVITGQREDRRPQRRQQLAHLLVLNVAAVVREIAGHQHGIRLWTHRAHALHRRRERRDGIAIGPVSSDVRIAELHDEKGRPHGGIMTRAGDRPRRDTISKWPSFLTTSNRHSGSLRITSCLSRSALSTTRTTTRRGRRRSSTSGQRRALQTVAGRAR